MGTLSVGGGTASEGGDTLVTLRAGVREAVHQRAGGGKPLSGNFKH